MDATINLIAGNNTITVSNTTINFSCVEMPYGAQGYRNNGSSTAEETDLNNYWTFVDIVLQQSNLQHTDYVTLKSIQTDTHFYGIL